VILGEIGVEIDRGLYGVGQDFFSYAALFRSGR
jgi:hypothetical protein